MMMVMAVMRDEREAKMREREKKSMRKKINNSV
jgi:hypothetical protein